VKNKKIEKIAHIVNIYNNNQLERTICVVGNLDSVHKKLEKWNREEQPLACYLDYFRNFNTCYLFYPTVLNTEYGFTDNVVIDMKPMLILGYGETNISYKMPSIH